ncbi:FAD/NAD(P)-binding domain-containing protein [Leucogyrophana mollusca]|uniref:FAD/NAD(P)-binding domain-containing protein n=1 Tax=Leucogyrophana mollusca TaxID=85980 RepID=A0ACB8BBE5_9AGAM|nr:FAD/NAD(P)-binding domain-containing protein [Leucogyrophana mollusca]
MPGDVLMIPRRTSNMLRFIVVGGSIAGLACAYSLQEAGHQVTVLEQSSGTYKSRGGIRSPPNMTRLLNHWGLGPAIAKASIKANQFTFNDGLSGELLGVLVLHDKIMKALLADFLYIQHGDLLTILYDLAKNAGVIFEYNTRVESVDPWAGSVTTQNGVKLTADVIIGADGYKSIVRTVVVGPQSLRGVRDKRVSVNLTVPTELMREHEDLIDLTESPEWTLWLGDDCAMHGLLTCSKREYAIVMHVPGAPSLPIHESWAEERPLDDDLLKLDRFEPRARKLVKLATSMIPTHYIIHEPFDNWVHESGKVVLVGEAAHPLMPNGSHNHAMSIEDAMTLSTLFSLPATRSQTPLLLAAYEELRQPRCAKTQSSERQKRDFICLPHGPEQRARDEGLREARSRALLDWDEADEEFLRDTWEEYIDLFAFDAREAVEDWWTKWGNAMRTRNGEAKSEAGHEKFKVPRLEINVLRDGLVV